MGLSILTDPNPDPSTDLTQLVPGFEAHRKFLDMQGDHVVEAAVADLLEDGEVQRHIRRVRRQYQHRRDTLVHLLRELPAGLLSFEVPGGGIAIWAGVHRPVDVDAWAERALEGGVAFQTARAFTFDRRPGPFARFGFAALDEHERRAAVSRLSSAVRSGSRISKSSRAGRP